MPTHLPPAAQFLIREATDFAMCIKCLHEYVWAQTSGTAFEQPVVNWYPETHPGLAVMAQARYYISALHVHYHLQSVEAQRAIEAFNLTDLVVFDRVLWRALMTFDVDWWLTDSADVTMLDGAIQFVRHRVMHLDLADFDPRFAAHLLALLPLEQVMHLSLLSVRDPLPGRRRHPPLQAQPPGLTFAIVSLHGAWRRALYHLCTRGERVVPPGTYGCLGSGCRLTYFCRTRLYPAALVACSRSPT